MYFGKHSGIFSPEEVMRQDRFFCNEELKREDVCRKMLTNWYDA